MRKWFAAILLIISIACSIIPCCRFDDCGGDEVETAQPTHQDEEQGGCSPFFSCTTCSGFTALTKTIQLPPLSSQKQLHYTVALAFTFPDYTASFWQPPRLT